MKDQIAILYGMLKDVFFSAVQRYNSVINKNIVHPFWAYSAIAFLCCYIGGICFFSDYSSYTLFVIPLIVACAFCLISKMFVFLANGDGKIFCHTKDMPSLSPYVISVLVLLFYVAVVTMQGYRDDADVRWQFQQIRTMRFDDWHPVIHTFSLYLLSRLSFNVYFILFCSISIFSLVCGWLYAVMIRHQFSRIPAFIIVVFIAVNPLTVSVMTSLLKDAAFCIVLLMITTIMIHLWYTAGKWLYSVPKAILFGVLLFYASFVRHNGFFFTLPIILFLPLIHKGVRKKLIMALFSVLIGISLLGYVSVRNILIEKNIVTQQTKYQKFMETVGLPLCVMSEVFVHYPENMSDEAKSFMTSINPPGLYRQYYLGDFNSVKWRSHVFEAFSNIQPFDFVHLFFDTFKRSSRIGVITIFRITSLTWWIDHPFSHSGFIILLLLTATVFSFLKNGWKVFFYAIPFFSYNFGTALLLNGWDTRFFCGIIASALPVIFMLITPVKTNNEVRRK